MVYSQEWCKGNIRGNQIGKIPKELLLLCLVSKRFTKAQDQLLSGLTRDFEISTIVQEAITGWKLSPTKYQKVRSLQKTNIGIWLYGSPLSPYPYFPCFYRFLGHQKTTSLPPEDVIVISVPYLSLVLIVATKRFMWRGSWSLRFEPKLLLA